jgi:hypothetical protein
MCAQAVSARMLCSVLIIPVLPRQAVQAACDASPILCCQLLLLELPVLIDGRFDRHHRAVPPDKQHHKAQVDSASTSDADPLSGRGVWGLSTRIDARARADRGRSGEQVGKGEAARGASDVAEWTEILGACDLHQQLDVVVHSENGSLRADDFSYHLVLPHHSTRYRSGRASWYTRHRPQG